MIVVLFAAVSKPAAVPPLSHGNPPTLLTRALMTNEVMPRDERPEKMRQRRETVEHPFRTIKARMGAMHFLVKTLPRVAAEMALHVLAYNLSRVMNIMGTKPRMAAMRA